MLDRKRGAGYRAMGFGAPAPLAVRVAVAAWGAYTDGPQPLDAWGGKMVPSMPFHALAGTIDKLGGEQVQRSQSLSTWQRLAAMRPDGAFLWWAGAGVGGGGWRMSVSRTGLTTLSAKGGEHWQRACGDGWFNDVATEPTLVADAPPPARRCGPSATPSRRTNFPREMTS